MRKMNGHPWDAKNSKAEDSRSWVINMVVVYLTQDELHATWKFCIMTFNKNMLDIFRLTKKNSKLNLFPFQFLIAQLSFVRITPFLIYHINIFILRRFFIHQNSCLAFKPLLTWSPPLPSIFCQSQTCNVV